MWFFLILFNLLYQWKTPRNIWKIQMEPAGEILNTRFWLIQDFVNFNYKIKILIVFSKVHVFLKNSSKIPPIILCHINYKKFFEMYRKLYGKFAGSPPGEGIMKWCLHFMIQFSTIEYAYSTLHFYLGEEREKCTHKSFSLLQILKVGYTKAYYN